MLQERNGFILWRILKPTQDPSLPTGVSANRNYVSHSPRFHIHWLVSQLFATDTFFLFQDLATDLFMKRLVRDYLHYDECVFCVASRIIRRLDNEAAETEGFQADGLNVGWSSLHVRHGEVSDFVICTTFCLISNFPSSSVTITMLIHSFLAPVY